MVKSGKHFEEIIENLNCFRSEIKSLSDLGLFNQNKHSENFLRDILNFTYGYELENLNKKSHNFPGLDLGDESEGVSYQITATKTSAKVDNTLKKCLDHKHYEKFKEINVFILTSKQDSYTLHTETNPHFDFDPKSNILDWDDLYKAIEQLSGEVIEQLRNYIVNELPSAVRSLKEQEPEESQSLIDVNADLQQVSANNYLLWKVSITLLSQEVNTPVLYSRLKNFFPDRSKQLSYLPMFNDSLRKPLENNEMIYTQKLSPDGASNIWKSGEMKLSQSNITIERARYFSGLYADNFFMEMVELVTSILFLRSLSNKNLNISISIHLETNGEVGWYNLDPLSPTHTTLNTYYLQSGYKYNKSINETESATIADLLQEILHGFTNSSSSDPFLELETEKTVFNINQIKNTLNTIRTNYKP
jgi:hypothetical protein